jgi:hypothetical protein
MSEEKEDKKSTLIKTAVDNGEKKKRGKAIVIINILAVAVIALIVTYFLFIKKDSPKEGLRGDVGRNMNIENICDNLQDKDQGDRSDNFDPEKSGDRERPEGMPDREGFNSEEFQKNMEERQNLISEICADGTVSDEEKEKFEAMQGDMPSAPQQN